MKDYIPPTESRPSTAFPAVGDRFPAHPSRSGSTVSARLIVASVCLTAALLCRVPSTSADSPYEREPINYLTAEASDAVAELKALVESKKLVLARSGPQGYLRAVLEALDIPISSQVLVFSKTSFQSSRITPRTPRALYFNDEVYIGYVQGGDSLEFSVVDPELGGVFYLLDQTADDVPEIERRTHDCLQCHVSGKTQDVPGHLVRSIPTEPSGRPVFSAGSFTTTQESPIRERWGGWYVTGSTGTQEHMGNVLTRVIDRSAPGSGDEPVVLDALNRFNPRPYLSPGSDVVALMVLEHQVKMHNLITVANYQAKLALQYAAEINKAFGEPAGAISETTARRFEGPAEQLVKYMLFVDEAELTDRVEGSSTFTKDFASRGPRDPSGRSLRDFDLTTRIFKHPCSYLIYSKAFDALPAPVKSRVYQRLWEVLTGKDQSPAYARRTPDERRAILEILLATKADLPDYWRDSRQALPSD